MWSIRCKSTTYKNITLSIRERVLTKFPQGVSVFIVKVKNWCSPKPKTNIEMKTKTSKSATGNKGTVSEFLRSLIGSSKEGSGEITLDDLSAKLPDVNRWDLVS